MAIPPLITLQFNSVAAGPCVVVSTHSSIYYGIVHTRL